MKRLIALLTTVVVTAVSSAFSSPDATAEESHHDNVLITYFSRAGENYSVGVVERGNTDLLAEIVAEETDGELFHIETVREYPSAYDEMLTVATEERTYKERPELKTSGVTMYYSWAIRYGGAICRWRCTASLKAITGTVKQ